ncbi:MAG: type II secretion system protein [Planctomycetota bacterium]|jgi:type II secretory pathway pseudopilin PulG
MKQRKAFTLIELLIVCAMIMTLASIMLPALGQARILAKRGACAANLNTVGKALVSYATEFNQNLPAFGSDDSSGSVQWNLVGHNKTVYTEDVQDGSRPLFMLMYPLGVTASGEWVRHELKLVPPAAFNCPGAEADERQTDPVTWEMGTAQQVGFDSYRTCSYSYQHSLTPDIVPPPSLIDKASRVMMADRTPLVRGPGTKQGYDGNRTTATSYDELELSGQGYDAFSGNHRQVKGQNVLRIGGDVEFTKSAIVDEDNIWAPGNPAGTPDSTFLSGGPVDEDDIFLVP